jgi:hypothetical protein
VAPAQTYPVASASCSGIAIVRDVLHIACLRGTRLYRAVIDGDRLTELQQHYVGTCGRLRTVEPTVDGNLWLTTSTGGDKDSIPEQQRKDLQSHPGRQLIATWMPGWAAATSDVRWWQRPGLGHR